MKTMRIGGALLATTAIAWTGLQMPVHSAGKSAPTTAQKASKKSILLSVGGMH